MKTLNHLKPILMTASVLVIALIFTNCSEEDPAPSKPSVALSQNSTLGSILVDGEGKTLYYFSNDADGKVNCSGECLTAWPPFIADELEIGTSLDSKDFSSVTTDQGTQVTYKGWPLYYYAPGGELEAAGSTSGEGAGNVWFVAKPDYSVMIAKGADGTYLTDAEGNTLYAFANDKFNVNNYTAADFSNDAAWPIFHSDKEAIPSTLSKTDFAEIEVHGKKQLTYKGWPLYYFGGDSSRGDAKGVSDAWPLLNSETSIAQ